MQYSSFPFSFLLLGEMLFSKPFLSLVFWWISLCTIRISIPTSDFAFVLFLFVEKDSILRVGTFRFSFRHCGNFSLAKKSESYIWQAMKKLILFKYFILKWKYYTHRIFNVPLTKALNFTFRFFVEFVSSLDLHVPHTAFTSSVKGKHKKRHANFKRLKKGEENPNTSFSYVSTTQTCTVFLFFFFFNHL